MATTIMDTVTSFMGPQIVGPLASNLGVSTDTAQRGLQADSAAILSGLASKADEPGFLSQVYGMVTNPANTPSALSSLTSNVGSASASPLMDMGNRFVSTIFGSRLPAVTDSLGKSAGLGGNKASMLMSMAGPLVLGALGQNVRENNLNASGLASELKSEAPGFQRLLPVGSGPVLSGTPSSAADWVPTPVRRTTNRWLWPVVVLALLLLGALWLFNRVRQPATDAVQRATNAVTSTASTALGNFSSVKLPSGVELNIPQNGIENKLIAYITDTAKPLDQTTWFNFDRLLFNTGQATLQPSSQEQLNNIALILKAYPNVNVKIGGYTDNTGDPAANMALSTARAKHVMDSLVAQGVDPSRLESQGYGDQHPVGDNSTDEGRAANRRIALQVTQR